MLSPSKTVVHFLFLRLTLWTYLFGLLFTSWKELEAGSQDGCYSMGSGILQLVWRLEYLPDTPIALKRHIFDRWLSSVACSHV